MAPKPGYEKSEACLCFHGPLMYEAKIEDRNLNDSDKKDVFWEYLLHYKGWKKTWDEWVPEKRLHKINEENLKWSKDLKSAIFKVKQDEEKQKRQEKQFQKSRKSGGSELGSSVRGSEERGSSAAAPTRGTKRGRDIDFMEKEDEFRYRPSIRIPVPDQIKGILVDDWENITKSNQLIPLPHPWPVDKVLEDYHRAESIKRRRGSAEEELLNEVIQGTLEYFDKSVGRILLYPFERQQWLDTHERMMLSKEAAAASKNELSEQLAGKLPSQIYGSEHLCRLFVMMPVLIAQTNMDSHAINRLRQEIFSMSSWLAKNAPKYFAQKYETAGRAYEDKSRAPAMAA